MAERRRVQGRRAAAAGLAAVFLMVAGSAAWGDITDSSGSWHEVSTGSLEPPTNPATAPGTCVLLVGDRIVVSWTRTASSWADGYQVLRSTAVGGPYTVVGTVAGRTTESYTDTTVSFATTYFYVVRATKASWRSAATAPVSRTTRSALCI